MCQLTQGLAMGIERINKKLHIARRGVLYSLVLCCLILLIG